MHVTLVYPGDPEQFAAALVETAASSAPPLHLFLGSDAITMAQQKLEAVRADLVRHEALSRSTDFPTTPRS